MSGCHPTTRNRVGGDRRSARFLLLPENGQSLLNQNSKQPTPKDALGFEPRQIAGSGAPTVSNSFFGPFGTAEHPACHEVKQPMTAQEPSLKLLGMLLPTFQADLILKSLSLISVPLYVYLCVSEISVFPKWSRMSQTK